MTTPSALLLAAADRLRDRAAAATPGSWSVDDLAYVEAIYSEDGTAVVAGGRWGGEASVFNDSADARWIAMLSPVVAPHLAAWLRASAASMTAMAEMGRGLYITESEQAAVRFAALVCPELVEDRAMSDPPKPRVTACPAPELAVMVGDTKVPVQPPDMLGLLSRVDLVVSETRADGEGVRYVALMGVPSNQPHPPSLTVNAYVQQVPLAYVSVKRQQWVIQECDIRSAGEDSDGQ